MAPPPEYDKEPKAPDKTVTNIPSEDSKALYNSVNEHQASSDAKSSNSSGNAEVENNKHVEALDDGQLRALLDEAITYKCPKDREGKSSLFKELLESVEQDEQACEAAWRAGRRRARGAGRRALPHSNSLQDLVAALAAEPAPRRRPPPHAPVSARALHGGSLPSGVDTSFLLSEEPARGVGAEYVATVRCVNPSPLAERRVSASDAHGPHETEPLNRRSKPAFPMYTARATLEIGSGAGPGAGRAVTTTTASNQVRTSPEPPGKPRGPRPAPRRDPHGSSDDKIHKWYRGLDHYTRGDPPFRPLPSPSVTAPLLKPTPDVNPPAPLTKRHDKNDIVHIDRDDESNTLDKNDDVEIEAARKQYRERVGRDLVIPTLSSINPQNVRSMSIGRSLPVAELDKVGPNANTDRAGGNKSVKDKHGRKTRNKNNRNSNVNVTDTPAPTIPDNKSGQSARPTKTCHDSVEVQTKPQSPHDAPKSNSNCDNQPKKVNKHKDTKEMSAKIETRTSKPEKGPELVEMVPLRTTFKTDKGNEFSLFFANQQRLLQAIETNSGIQVETDNVIIKPDHNKSQQKEKENSEILKQLEKNTKNLTNATERSASEEPITVVKIGGMCFKVGTCEKSNPVLKKEPPSVVKIRGAPDFKVGTCEKSKSTLKKETPTVVKIRGAPDFKGGTCEKSNPASKKDTPTVVKIRGAPDFKESDNVIKKPDNNKKKEKEKSETLKHVEKNTKNVKTNATERSASEEPTTVVKIGGMCFKVGTCEKSNPVLKKEPPSIVKIRGAPDFKVGTCEKSNSTLKKEPPTVVKIRGAPDFKVGTCEKSNPASKNEPPIVLTIRGVPDFKESDNVIKKPDNNKKKDKEKSETLKHVEKNTKNVKTNATERSASEEPTTVVKIGGMCFKVGTCEKSNPVLKKEPPSIVKIREAPDFKVGTCEKSNPELKEDPPAVVKIRGAPDFKVATCEKSNSELKKEPPTVVKIRGAPDFKVATSEKINPELKKEPPSVVKIRGAPDFKVGTCAKSSTAEIPTDHSIFLTLYKRLLASPANADRADAKRPAEPRPALAALDALDAAAAKPPKKKKDKITARLARKPHNENSTKKKDIIRNALKKLFFDNITQSDSTQLTDNAAPASKSEEVDSAIPFSCISSPEVAPSADAAPAAPPDLKIPRNALASSFGAAARAVPALGASDEFKKSLDENGNAVPGFGSPQAGSGQQKKQRRKKTSKNETVIKSHHIDGYQGNKDLNEVLRFIESAPERSKHDKKKRSAERRAKPAPRASSLDDLRAPPPPRPAPPHQAPAKPERRSWGDERAYRREPEPELELADFQTVTKKRRARRRASPGPRARARSPGAPAPAPRSDRSDSNDDVESVRSLPALPARAPASYADIARTRNNIPDLIESCNFYAVGAGGAAPGGYPALEARGKPAPAPAPAAPDVLGARPPVVLLAAARAQDLDGVTFGFDVNEQLLARPPRYLPPAAPAAPHLQQIVDYVGSAWEEAVRCAGGKARYFSE